MKLFFLGIGVLFILSLISLSLGSQWILPSHFWNSDVRDIVWGLRFPRILLAIGVGGALAMGGHILQIVLKNELADPYILGVSSASALGAAVGFILGASFLKISVLAFLASMTCLLFLIFISSQKESISMSHGLLLSGILIGFFCSSLVSLFLILAHPFEGSLLLFWLMGSLAKPFSLETIIIALGFILGLSFLVQYRSHSLNLLTLGDEQAQVLGINTKREKNFFLIYSSLFTAIAVSLTGMIGFVGLMVPHAVRSLWGIDSRHTLLLNFIAGGSFLLVTDTLIRTLFTQEIPIGAVTSLLGAPIFLMLLRRKT